METPVVGIPFLGFYERQRANGWTEELLASLPHHERMSLGDFRPGEPRLPCRQKDIHDLFAGKTYIEIRTLLEQYLNPALREYVPRWNLRTLRRVAGIRVTATTTFDKVVYRVEEWSYELLKAGAMVDGIIERVKSILKVHDLQIGQDYTVPLGSRLGEELEAVVADYEHLGINAMQRACVKCLPTTLGIQELESLRNKISRAATLGSVTTRPARLLGQYQSYFEENRLQQLTAVQRSQIARSLGLPLEAGVQQIHKLAERRFAEKRNLPPDQPCIILSSITAGWPAESNTEATRFGVDAAVPAPAEVSSVPILTLPSPASAAAPVFSVKNLDPWDLL